MKAYVTSIGENTTKLCCWALERNGFEVVLLTGEYPLVKKLEKIYGSADEDFVRVDADVVVNKTFTPGFINDERVPEIWWLQFKTYDWHKQDVIFGGVQHIRKEALPCLRRYVAEYTNSDRPETMLARIAEFYNPRRFESSAEVVGLHGFAANDIERVRQQKKKREYYHQYDFELAAKLERLLK